MSYRFILTLACLVGVAWAPAAVADQDGPRADGQSFLVFPSSVLNDSDATLATMAPGRLASEIDRLLPRRPPDRPAAAPNADPLRQQCQVDMRELGVALQLAGLPAEKRQAVLRQYRDCWNVVLAVATPPANGEPRSPRHMDVLPQLALPPEVPAEFALCLHSLAAYFAGQRPEARRLCLQLLSLPPDQRVYRSTWAAFTAGLASLPDEPGDACPYFHKTRALAADGYADSLNLAAASLTGEAVAERRQKHYARAIHLYMNLRQTGSDSALESLRLICNELASTDAVDLKVFAADPMARAVATAYLASLSGGEEGEMPECAGALLEAIDAAGANDFRMADRVAWAAYAQGNFVLARKWVSRSDTGIARWLRAKLLAKDGQLDDAAASLAKAIPLLRQDLQTQLAEGDVSERAVMFGGRTFVLKERSPMRQAAGELAVLQMSRGKYADALDLLMQYAWWPDAAYVAERVLNVDELKAYVDRQWPGELAAQARGPLQPPGPRCAKADTLKNPRPLQARDIRWLLARRLVRAGRYQEALPYFAPELRKQAATLAAHMAVGNDTRQDKAKRAAELWAAAQLVSTEGLPLLGTELNPDLVISRGERQDYCGTETESESEEGSVAPPWAPPPGDVFDQWATEQIGGQADTRRGFLTTQPAQKAADDEQERTERHDVAPDVPRHYLHVAAKLAMRAAELMPDNDERTANVLLEAAQWVLNRQNDRNDEKPFYEAIISRCPHTKIGQWAKAHENLSQAEARSGGG